VAAAGEGPSVVTLIGVIPEWIATGVELSPRVEAAVGRAVMAVVAAFEELGVAPVLRVHPSAPHIWWTRRSPVGTKSPTG
jgi:predicted polyphosphate/ATP-dependent NAD kinase